MISKNNTQSLIVIDCIPSGIIVDRCEIDANSIDALVNSLHLHLPQSGLKFSSETEMLDGDPVENLKQVEERLNDISQSVVVLGFMSDPLFPYEKRFDVTLKILEFLAGNLPKHLIIQTRSPLILLALPVLQSIKERVTVTFAFETNQDATQMRFAAQLPRPSERVKAVRALRRFGFKMQLQLSPIIPSLRAQTVAVELAQELAELNCPVRVVSVEQLTTKKLSNNQSRWTTNSCDLLIRALNTCAPNLLVESGYCTRDNLHRSLAA